MGSGVSTALQRGLLAQGLAETDPGVFWGAIISRFHWEASAWSSSQWDCGQDAVPCGGCLEAQFLTSYWPGAALRTLPRGRLHGAAVSMAAGLIRVSRREAEDREQE